MLTDEHPDSMLISRINCPGDSLPSTIENMLQARKVSAMQHGGIYATKMVVANLQPRSQMPRRHIRNPRRYIGLRSAPEGERYSYPYF